VPVSSSFQVVPKPVVWIASSRDDLREFPEDVKDTVGHALWFAQTDRKHDSAKPLKGFGSAGVLEVIESFERNAYRAVYTVKFEAFVYVLHCFQKKSKRGRETPRTEMDMIHSRLRLAEEDHKRRREERTRHGR
jgi:phage-related protein